MADKLLSAANGVMQPENINLYTPDSVNEINSNGFFTVDQSWIVKSWNRAAEKLLRVPANDILGKNLWETFAGTLPIHFYTTYHKTLLRDIPSQIRKYWPYMHSWFDIRTFYWDDRLSVSFKSDKPVQAEFPEQQLKVLNELYRSVSEVTNDCLWDWDIRSGEVFWIDGGHKRVFGYPIENMLIPRSFCENQIHPDDKVRVLTGLNKIINESLNPVWEDEYRFRKLNDEYAYVHDRGHIFRDEKNVATRMIGATQDITARKLTEIQLLQERQAKQREITNAVLTAQENERAALSRDLQDNLNQILAVTKLYIEMAGFDRKNKGIYLENSSTLISNSIEKVRDISKSLVIPGMHGLGLFDNIRNLIRDLTGPDSVKFEFHTIRIKEKDLDEQLQLNIFRIIQEQVNNILKHSAATRAFINLSKTENQIILQVSDDGKGYLMPGTGKGVGIRNIMSRAELCNGMTEIKSSPGEGFLLKVFFRLPDRDHL